MLHELIQFNNKYIYCSEQAEGYKTQAGKMIGFLFDDLVRELKRTHCFTSGIYSRPPDSRSVPLVYRVLKDFVQRDMKGVYRSSDPRELIVLDFVAGMTDSFAMRSVSDVFIPKMTV